MWHAINKFRLLFLHIRFVSEEDSKPLLGQITASLFKQSKSVNFSKNYHLSNNPYCFTTSNQKIMATGSRSNQQSFVQSVNRTQYPHIKSEKMEVNREPPLNPSHSLPSQSSNYVDQIDRDEQLLILYLLPIYKRLKTEDQREVLYSCYSIIQQQLLFYQMSDVKSRIKKEEPESRENRIRTDTPIIISDDEI